MRKAATCWPECDLVRIGVQSELALVTLARDLCHVGSLPFDGNAGSALVWSTYGVQAHQPGTPTAYGGRPGFRSPGSQVSSRAWDDRSHPRNRDEHACVVRHEVNTNICATWKLSAIGLAQKSST